MFKLYYFSNIFLTFIYFLIFFNQIRKYLGFYGDNDKENGNDHCFLGNTWEYERHALDHDYTSKPFTRISFIS